MTFPAKKKRLSPGRMRVADSCIVTGTVSSTLSDALGAPSEHEAPRRTSRT